MRLHDSDCPLTSVSGCMSYANRSCWDALASRGASSILSHLVVLVWPRGNDPVGQRSTVVYYFLFTKKSKSPLRFLNFLNADDGTDLL